jgi:hypothetical protein
VNEVEQKSDWPLKLGKALGKLQISTVIAVLSAIAAVASALFSCQQTRALTSQLHLHIEPEVEIGFSFLDKHQTFQPIISLRNASPINVVSLSADYVFLRFNKNTNTISWQGSLLPPEQYLQGHLIFEKKLEPNDYVARETGDVLSSDNELNEDDIFIFAVFSFYYCEPDMKCFNKRIFFFVEKGKVIQHPNFINHVNYKDIAPILNGIEPPSFGSLHGAPGEFLLKRGQKNSSDSETEQNNKIESRNLGGPLPLTGIKVLHTK